MKNFWIVCLVLLFIWAGSACASSTQYDNLEILKIESSWVEGMADFPCAYRRTFDFKTGKITDTRVVDEKDVPQEDETLYNRPKQIAAFTPKQAEEFISTVRSLGLYTWKNRYETDDIVYDGGSQTVRIYFTDGTIKFTFIYFKYPPHYEDVKQAFETYLGAELYMKR